LDFDPNFLFLPLSSRIYEALALGGTGFGATPLDCVRLGS
jgi:hypothetical protein